MRGNLGQAPSKVLDADGLAAGGRRWRFVKLRDRLRFTSARPSALPSVDYALNSEGVSAEDTIFSHFSSMLAVHSESNITASFVAYSSSVHPLSLSLPLIFRNRKKLVDLSIAALHQSTANAAEATLSIATCIAALGQDIGPDHFHPLFPQIVAAFAQTFKTSSSDTDAHESIAPSALWDPDTTLVPLFAAIADMTKNLLQPLASNPDSTLQSLLPLLSSSHYRIREMTAEACLGYLIRKTRDGEVRNRFVVLLVQALPEVVLQPSSRDHLCDGLGASLYEAVRLPSGRLHSRAVDVLSVAVEQLSKEPNPDEAAQSENAVAQNRSLLVVSRCLSGLLRHLSNSSDVQKVTVVLAMAGEKAMKDSNPAQLANVLFLCRKWFEFGGVKNCNLLGQPTCQRFANFFCEAVKKFKDDTRVVFESFGSICAMYRHTSESFRQKSMWGAIFVCLNALSLSSSSNALIATLQQLFAVRNIEWQKVNLNMAVPSVAKVCDRLAALHNDSSIANEMDALCKPAMSGTLMFFELVIGDTLYAPSDLPAYSVPSLEAQTRNLLASFFKASKDGKAVENGFKKSVSDALRLWSAIKISDGADILGELFYLSGWSVDDRASLLNAVFRQTQGKPDLSSELWVKALQLLRDSMSSTSIALSSVRMCSALQRILSIDGIDVDSLFREVSEQCEQPLSLHNLKRRLTENLSVEDALLRAASLNLLRSLAKKEESVPDQNGTKWQSHRGLDEDLTLLRSFFQEEASSSFSLIGILQRIMQVSPSMESIGSTLRLVQELNRIIQTKPSLPTHTLFLLNHFSIGLFHIPLKPLWESAGELWSSLASHDSDALMSITLTHLSGLESTLLAAKVQSSDETALEQEIITEDETSPTDGKAGYPVNEDTGNNNQSNGDSKAEVLSQSTSLGKRPRSSSSSNSKAQTSKKSRVNDRKKTLLRWNSAEWKSRFSDEYISVTASSDTCSGSGTKFGLRARTEPLTMYIEILNALSKDPKHTIKYRSGLIESYLKLDSSKFSRKRGIMMGTSFASLLEKMGGLRCCESDTGLEARMRARLLLDIARSGSSCQSAALKCLCVSRSPSLKPLRESFLRLIKDASFREELSLLTESHFAEWNEFEEHEITPEQEVVVDVLIRICVSKMSGSSASVGPRKGAVLSFVSSKLPSKMALSRITNLLLEPLAKSIKAMEESQDGCTRCDKLLPNDIIIRAVLGSVETVVKQCRLSLPPESWRMVAIAGLLALRSAGQGSVGQNTRSRSLKMLADMCRARPEETLFIAPDTLRAMKRTGVDTLDVRSVTGAPALLSFIGAVCEAGGFNICMEHRWTILFCFRLMRSPNADAKAVGVALSVGLCLVDVSEVQTPSVRSGEKCPQVELVKEMNTSLCSVLAILIEKMTGNKNRQKTWSFPFERALLILERSVTIEHLPQDEAVALTHALGSFLEKPCHSALSPASSLRALSAIFRTQPHEAARLSATVCLDKESLIRNIVPLLSARRFVKDDVSYQALCGMLGTGGTRDLEVISHVLKDMNSMQYSRLGAPDLERRLTALNTVVKSLKNGLGGTDDGPREDVKDISIPVKCMSDELVDISSPAVLIAVCHGCIAAIFSEDIAVRGTAGYCLKLLCRWVGYSETNHATASRSEIFSTVALGVVNAKRIVIRREYSLALREFAKSCKNIVHTGGNDDPITECFSFLRALASEGTDSETDFFENLVHLQAHRRSRALRQLEKFFSQSVRNLEDPDDDEHSQASMFAHIFAIPLGTNIALEVPDKDEQQRLRRSRKFSGAREDAVKDIAHWAVSVVASASKLLGWTGYTRTLDGFLRKLDGLSDEDDCQIHYKLLLKTAEAFPVSLESRCPPVEVTSVYLTDSLLPRMLQHIRAGAIEGNLLHSSEKESIPNPLSAGKDKRKSLFRAPVALAAAQLMTLVPGDSQESLLSLLITPLVTSLRSKTLSIRETSKKALVSVIFTLGPRYLPYILNQVLATLRDDSRKDVIIYFLHALLEGIRSAKKKTANGSDTSPFVFDSSVDTIVLHVIGEVRSGISETRRDFEDPNATDARLKQAAARASKAYECAELLAELVTFQKSATSVCLPFLIAISKATSSKLIGRARELLVRLLLGFPRNSSVNLADAFMLCYKLISRVKTTVVVEADEADKNETNEFEEVRVNHAVNFGLQLLNAFLSKNMDIMLAKSGPSGNFRHMCAPLLPLVIESLKTGDDEVTLSAFRAMQRLLRLPLRSRKDLASGLCDTIVEVLSQSAGTISASADNSGGDELFNSCLRAAAVLLKEVKTSEFKNYSAEKVDTLLTIACHCIENGTTDSRSAALALLRSVISARISLPSVYDAMEKVNKLAIHAQSSSLRTSCTSLSISFLVSFQMGAKRVRQHLEFFVQNLNYELPSGRLASLEAIRDLVTKFPDKILEEEGQYLLIALAANLSRETDAQCLECAHEAVRLLFERIPQGPSLVDLLKVAATLVGVQLSMTGIDEEPQLVKPDDPSVLRSGAVCLSAACKSGQLSLTQSALVVRVVALAVERVKLDDGWETSYALLQCAESAFAAQPAGTSVKARLEVQRGAEKLWKLMPTLLLHRHQWVRLSASRLIGSHFSAVGGRKASAKTTTDTASVWGVKGLPREVLRACCLQLEANHLSADLGQQCLKNILCIADVIWNHPTLGDLADHATLDDGEVDGGEQLDIEEQSANEKRCIRWLLSRMSGIAIKVGGEEHDILRRGCALRFLLVTSKWWGVEAVKMYIGLYVLPVVRVLESGDMVTDVVPEQDKTSLRRKGHWEGEDKDAGESLNKQALRTICETLQSALVDVIGADEYYKEYQRLQTQRTALKQEKKRRAALLAAIDPEREAKRRRKRAEARNEKRKAAKGKFKKRRNELMGSSSMRG